MSEINDQVIEEFRANGGVVREAMGGHFKDVHLLLLHNVGRRTGRELVTPLLYLADGGNFVLLGSSGGAEKEPPWVANLEATPAVTVEVGDRTLAATATVLREGPERARLYAALTEYWPDVLKYETTTTRQFPVISLVPTA